MSLGKGKVTIFHCFIYIGSYPPIILTFVSTSWLTVLTAVLEFAAEMVHTVDVLHSLFEVEVPTVLPKREKSTYVNSALAKMYTILLQNNYNCVKNSQTSNYFE